MVYCLEWSGFPYFTSFELDFISCDLTIDGESLELKCVTPCLQSQLAPQNSLNRCWAIQNANQSFCCIHPLLKVHLSMLHCKPWLAILTCLWSQFPSIPVSNANTHSDTTISSRGMLVKLPHWDNLCCKYSDLFEAPGFPVECQIKYCIDLLNPNLPVKHHRQYCMLPTELEEVHS